MSRLSRAGLVAALLCGTVAAGYLWVAPRLVAQTTAPVVAVETSQGTFTIEWYAKEAPLSVAHIVKLVRAGFYDGQRVHRAIPHFVMQFGDPQTRDLAKQELWGRGAGATSGSPLGLAEMPLSRKNVTMAVGLAHMGEPGRADSQLYIMLADKPELDGQYAVIGHVVEGQDVPPRLAVGDQILKVYVRE